MRDYILSLVLLVVLLGGYTALVINHHSDGQWRNQAAVDQGRNPSSNLPGVNLPGSNLPIQIKSEPKFR